MEGHEMTRILAWSASGLVVLALACSIALLTKDAGAPNLSRLSPAAISAAPLLLVGVAFLLVQAIIRPKPLALFRSVILAGTFLLWGVVQLLPSSNLSARLGDLVIALYVLDLAWAVLIEVRRIPRQSA